MELTLTLRLKNGSKITLTEEQARELHRKLDELFGDDAPQSPWVIPYSPAPENPWGVWQTPHTWTSDGTTNAPFEITFSASTDSDDAPVSVT